MLVLPELEAPFSRMIRPGRLGLTRIRLIVPVRRRSAEIRPGAAAEKIAGASYPTWLAGGQSRRAVPAQATETLLAGRYRVRGAPALREKVVRRHTVLGWAARGRAACAPKS